MKKFLFFIIMLLLAWLNIRSLFSSALDFEYDNAGIMISSKKNHANNISDKSVLLRKRVAQAFEQLKNSNFYNEYSLHMLLTLLDNELMLIDFLVTGQTGSNVQEIIEERDKILHYSPAKIRAVYDSIMNLATYNSVLESKIARNGHFKLHKKEPMLTSVSKKDYLRQVSVAVLYAYSKIHAMHHDFAHKIQSPLNMAKPADDQNSEFVIQTTNNTIPSSNQQTEHNLVVVLILLLIVGFIWNRRRYFITAFYHTEYILQQNITHSMQRIIAGIELIQNFLKMRNSGMPEICAQFLAKIKQFGDKIMTLFARKYKDKQKKIVTMISQTKTLTDRQSKNLKHKINAFLIEIKRVVWHSLNMISIFMRRGRKVR